MLHVLVGAFCNNNCVFCMESDRSARKKHIEGQTEHDIIKSLKEYANRDEVMFTSGEPTMNDKLQSYVAIAKKEGFRVVSLISNGRRLAYGGYAKNLLELGINKITISIHGHTSALHDGLVGAKGAFDQACGGLINLTRLRTRYKFELHTSTVLVKKNTPHLPAIHAFLKSHRPDRICFNVMMAKGRGAEHFEQLMPDYATVAESMAGLLSKLSEQEKRNLSLIDIPRCAARNLPPNILGASEHYDQFEPTGSIGIGGLEVEAILGRAEQGEPAACELLQAENQSQLHSDHEYYLTSRELKDQLLRSKGPQCDLCSYKHQCPGVWSVYAERKGWEEFRPIE